MYTVSNSPITYILLLPVLMNFCVTVSCANTDKCYLNNKITPDEEQLFNRISPLVGQIFRTEKDGYTYSVSICSDTSKLYKNVSATRSKVKDETLILGRRNESHITGGDAWVMLRYDCNKCSNSTEKQCLGHHSASIYLVCSPFNHEDPVMSLTEEDEHHYKFVIPTSVLCTREEEVSGTTVFFILLSVAFFMYFVIGIIYRRLVHKAHGCQQLPHFSFWQKVGSILSDGCNYICRCDSEEDTWNTITGNFDCGDRDDALLRP